MARHKSLEVTGNTARPFPMWIVPAARKVHHVAGAQARPQGVGLRDAEQWIVAAVDDQRWLLDS